MKDGNMMEFGSFVEYIKSRLPKEIKEKLPEYEVEFDVTPKVNGAKHSIRGGRTDDKIMKNIYIEDLYADYLEHQDTSKIIEHIVSIIESEDMPVKSDEFIELVNNPDKIRNLISYFVVNREFNEELLQSIPHRYILDLAVIYKFTLYTGDEPVGKVIVTNEMASKWSMTEEDLYKAAEANTEKLYPTVVSKVASDFIIVTNKSAINGAAAIIGREAIKKAANDIGEDVYIVPSSVHDLILLKTSMHKPSNIMPVIKHVNDDVVNKEDVLSYNLYRYSIESDEISIVSVNTLQ